MDMKQYISNAIERYTEIPSPSCSERKFLDYLIANDFARIKNMSVSSEKVLLIGDSKNSKPLFIAHTDRIALSDQVSIYRDDIKITGQLDNTLSIAILSYLVNKKDLSLNILLTTQEEICGSVDQITETIKQMTFLEPIPVVLDVDIYPDEESPCITYSPLKPFLSTVAITKKSQGWHISEAGFVYRYANRQAIAFMGIPISNLHSAKESAYWESIDMARKMIEQLVAQ